MEVLVSLPRQNFSATGHTESMNVGTVNLLCFTSQPTRQLNHSVFVCLAENGQDQSVRQTFTSMDDPLTYQGEFKFPARNGVDHQVIQYQGG